MIEYVGELKLKSPLTKEDWEIIADADFKNTNKVTFTTPHCGEVEFVKVVRCKDCKYATFYHGIWGCKYNDSFDGDFFCANGERKTDGTD